MDVMLRTLLLLVLCCCLSFLCYSQPPPRRNYFFNLGNAGSDGRNGRPFPGPTNGNRRPSPRPANGIRLPSPGPAGGNRHPSPRPANGIRLPSPGPANGNRLPFLGPANFNRRPLLGPVDGNRRQSPGPAIGNRRSSASPANINRRPSPAPANENRSPSSNSEQSQENCWLASDDIACDANSPYRTIDGSCNNLQHPSWGQSVRPLARFLPPRYNRASRKAMRRIGLSGRPLPSTRLVSTTLHKLANDDDFSPSLTAMHMLWGQFIDHDITRVPLVPMVKCCDLAKSSRASKDCIPISIPKTDPYWRNTRSCMELRRSLAINPGQCANIINREQINNLTSFIDGSAVYGSTDVQANQLRAFTGGLLRTEDSQMPITSLITEDVSAKCSIPHHDVERRCFAAGDKRSNVWPGLTSIHELFVREHNRIAGIFYGKLSSLHPDLAASVLDEKAFQEARRVVGALLQVVNYGEYLPHVLGQSEMRKWRLQLEKDSNRDYAYRSNVNPTSSNVFGAAAFRFGHAQIGTGTQPRASDYSNSTGFVSYDQMFNSPGAYRAHGFGQYIRGVTVEPALDMTGSGKFADAVRDKLFARSFNGSGLDLPAVNNQRGREQGIPPYNEWRSYCNLPTVTFQNMPDHTSTMKKRFKRLYHHADDIDLFSAAITEKPVTEDAVVGPTFACLLGKQFQRFKEGDRYWFESRNSYKNPFTADQIRQLSDIKLSKIICLNSNTESIPRDSFQMGSPMVRCSELPDLDLRNWKIVC